MRKLTKILMVVILTTIGCAAGADAWDVEYNAATGLLPTAALPAWHFDDYGAGSGVSNGVLYIYSDASGSGYRREEAAIGVGVPVTMETRTSVQSTKSGGASLFIETFGCSAYIGIYPDRIVTTDRYYQSQIFWQDFTTFRTIRLAYDGNEEAYMWVDNQLALSWTTPLWGPATGDPGGISFGSYESQSAWLYVNYSKAFAPVPEHSSILALLTGLAGIGGAALKRRKT